MPCVERVGMGDELLAQVIGELVHDATGHAFAGHVTMLGGATTLRSQEPGKNAKNAA